MFFVDRRIVWRLTFEREAKCGFGGGPDDTFDIQQLCCLEYVIGCHHVVLEGNGWCVVHRSWNRGVVYNRIGSGAGFGDFAEVHEVDF